MIIRIILTMFLFGFAGMSALEQETVYKDVGKITIVIDNTTDTTYYVHSTKSGKTIQLNPHQMSAITERINKFKPYKSYFHPHITALETEEHLYVDTQDKGPAWASPNLLDLHYEIKAPARNSSHEDDVQLYSDLSGDKRRMPYGNLRTGHQFKIEEMPSISKGPVNIKIELILRGINLQDSKKTTGQSPESLVDLLLPKVADDIIKKKYDIKNVPFDLQKKVDDLIWRKTKKQYGL